jgi:cation diffusion facilitator CzcD-associated flavoprotein CzcO
MTVKQKRVVRVAVIGIGSAGLAQLKQLKEAYARPAIADDVELELVGFESRADVGGIW